LFDSEQPRKIEADVFIDDRNLGGFPGWGKTFEMLCPEESSHKLEKKILSRYKKKGFLNWLLGH